MQINWHELRLMLRRFGRAFGASLRNAPLVIMTLAITVALETFGWAYLFLTNRESAPILGVQIPMALIEGVIITASGLVGMLAAYVAGERRTDPRPEVQATAWRAQALAFVMLAAPILKAADGFAFPQQVDAAEAFAASDQAREYARVARESTDVLERDQARARMAQGITPTRAQIDGTWFACFAFAAFLYVTNMLAASMLWRVKPETPAERTARERREERERRERRQEREHDLALAQLKAKAKGKGWWLAGVFNGRKKAAA
jgi:hypothetical protein